MKESFLRSEIEDKLVVLKNQLTQVIAQANAIEGAIQLVESLLKEEDPKSEESR